jgi:TorA maturation chaperone TorD
MTAATAPMHDMVTAAGRSLVYSLLATGFARPTADRIRAIRAVLLPAIESLDLPQSIETALQEVGSSIPTDLGEAAAAHLSLFPPISSQDAPGYETAYRGDGIFQQSTLLADIAGFYRAHGLRAGGEEKERLDHIVVELEFMALVARKELSAAQADRVEAAEVCRRTAEQFLRDHLACWAAAFGRRCSTVSDDRWLQALGSLLAPWVEADAAALGVTPVEEVDQPLAQEPPDDGACGPCPVPVSTEGWA